MIKIFKSKKDNSIYIENNAPINLEEFIMVRDGNSFTLGKIHSKINEVKNISYDKVLGINSTGEDISFTSPNELENYLNDFYNQDLIGINSVEKDLIKSIPDLSLDVINNTTQLVLLAEEISNRIPRASEDDTITINQSSANNFTTAWNKTITWPISGSYIIELFCNYNNDSTTSDLVLRATLDNESIDLNDRNAVPQGQFQILRAEVKESANSPGGAITGTGSGQKYAYNGKFLIKDRIANSTSDFQLDIGSEGNNIESAIWNKKIIITPCVTF